MDYTILLKFAGFALMLTVFSVRIERRLSRIETDVSWLKKGITDVNYNKNNKDKR